MEDRFRGRQFAIAALLWAALCPSSRAVEKAVTPGALPVLPSLGGTAANPNLQTGLNAQLPQIQVPALPAINAESAKLVTELTAPKAEQIPAEQQRAMAGEILGEGKHQIAASAVDPVPGSISSFSPLTPNGGEAGAPQAEPPQPKPARAPAVRPSVKERSHYNRLWYENLYFYIVTNILNKWGDYQKQRQALIDKGFTPAVSQPRKFFAYMRVMGQTGEFCVPGFMPREDAAVVDEARETFEKYFDSPEMGEKERKAFEGFLGRALVYNAEKRAASKFRAMVRDTMLKASVQEPADVAQFFDGLPTAAKTAEFQAGAADLILNRFKAVAMEEILKEPADAKDRITGLILIGSFAIGAATPTSDFDIEPLTADGGSGRVKEFSQRLIKRWADEGRQKVNPITFHMFGYLNSRWELAKIHHEPYIILSPDPAIVDNLTLRPGEQRLTPSRTLSRRGKLYRWLQYVAVYGTSLTVKSPKK